MREPVSITAVSAMTEAEPCFVEASWFLPGGAQSQAEVFNF